MGTHQRWTQADITSLRARLLTGASVDDIADTTKRSPEDVRDMMIRLRLHAIAPA